MTKDFAVIPFNSGAIADKYLISNMLGGWDILGENDFKLFSSLKCNRGTPLFNRLYERGLIADERNFNRLLEDHRNLNSNLFYDASLHIAVITTHCNLRCRYCQAHAARPEHMSLKVARRTVQCIAERKTPYITLEFQGGESTLNWNVLVFLTKSIRKLERNNRKIDITLISNLTALNANKMQFFKDYSVNICASLDGPKHIHDQNRIFGNGKGTYDVVIRNIKKLRKQFKKSVNFLPTITKSSLCAFKEIIDEYVRWGATSIALRPVNHLGNACSNWRNLGYSAEEFMTFYKNALDYILELNKKGIFIRERMAKVILQKVFNKEDPYYVDMMSPCGAGRGQIVYMPDGSCYPCDEARMVGGKMFRLGNILNETYETLVKKENLLHLLETSAINLWDYASVLSPWIGVCPVLNYTEQKNFVPKIHCSFIYKIHEFRFKYIFEKIAKGGQDLEILKSWVAKKEGENEKE